MDLAKQHVVLCMNYYPKNDYWFSLELEKHGVDYTIVGIPESQRAFFYKGILGNIYQNLYKLFRVIRIARNCTQDSVVLSMDDTATAVFSAVLLNMFGHKRTVVLMNMIDNLSNNPIKKYLYKRAFKNMYASCANEDILQLYSTRYCEDKKRLFLLPDCYANWGKAILEKNEPVTQGDYIFTGGSSYRDWDLFIEVARRMPNQMFVGVARKGRFDIADVPQNCTMFFDLDGAKFGELLRNSKIVFMPINIKTQGGQIVIFQAGLYKKAVVSTDTIAVRDYIEDGVNGGLVAFKDVDDAVETLTELAGNQSKIDQYSEGLHNTIIQCSPANFVSKLFTFLKGI